MPNIDLSTPLSQTASSIEPVKEKRLELGKKVFKVPTQSKRRSSRIQRPEAKSVKRQKKTTAIVHHLLLAPTLKRQKKKKLEREKKTYEQQWDFNSNSEIDIKLSDIFKKKRSRLSKRRQSMSRNITIVLDDTDIYAVRKMKKTSDSIKIRHLARCGGVQCISGLDVSDDKRSESRRDSKLPSPFEARNSDPYIPPKPGQLISYIWHSRPSPVLGRKQIYRTGILCSNDGTIRFFESDNDCVSNNDEDRKFYEGRFYLNKQVFKKGNFRVRTDLVAGAICYERENKLPCRIIKIDEKCGAVLVESLKPGDGGMKHIWISPDDLIGNYEVSKTSNDQNRENMMKSINVFLDDVQNHQSSNTETTDQIGQISPKCVSSVQETIDLTQEDEDESHHGLFQSLTACQESNGIDFKSKLESSPEIITPRYTSNDSSSQSLHIGTTSLPCINNQITSNNEGSIVSAVANVCKTFSTISGLPSNGYNIGRDFRNQNLHDDKFTDSLPNLPWLPERSQSNFLRFADENLRARDSLKTSSNMAASATLHAPLRAQALSHVSSIMGSSSSTLLYSGATIQSELDLLKQHGMALEVLMSATDLGTQVAALQYIKRLHQRGIPVGPTAANLVSKAEITSRTLMKDTFLRHMIASRWSGGKGYSVSHAGLILRRLAPIFGSNLGRLDSPTVDSIQLLSLGLNRSEILDILPYIQSFEDDILLKTLSFKRQLANVY